MKFLLILLLFLSSASWGAVELNEGEYISNDYDFCDQYVSVNYTDDGTLLDLDVEFLSTCDGEECDCDNDTVVFDCKGERCTFIEAGYEYVIQILNPSKYRYSVDGTSATFTQR